VADNGTVTSEGTGATGWGLDNSGADAGLRICLLDGCGAGPQRVILGPPNGSNVYSNANASIAGNDPHNPFLNGTVTFAVTVPGLTALSNVTGATFSFGTTEGSIVSGVPGPGGSGITADPEPATWMLLFGGGLILAFRRRKLA